jgi:hypothetical protein
LALALALDDEAPTSVFRNGQRRVMVAVGEGRRWFCYGHDHGGAPVIKGRGCGLRRPLMAA